MNCFMEQFQTVLPLPSDKPRGVKEMVERSNDPKWDFLLWLSGLQTRLVSTRMRVQSLASLGGLRIAHGCGRGADGQLQL